MIMVRFKKMSGERLFLSPLCQEDAAVYAAWMNDANIARYLGPFDKLITAKGAEKGLLEPPEDTQRYAIVLHDSDRFIGIITLKQINHLNRSATLSIVIGDAANHSKGYGAEAIRLLLEYAFKWLNLSNILLKVHAPNLAAIACYQKVGFREIGRRTASEYVDGEYLDDVYMEILPEMFYRS